VGRGIMNPNEKADFWYYEKGNNVIPADSPKKIPLVKWREDPRGDWGVVPIPISYDLINQTRTSTNGIPAVDSPQG